MGIAVKNKERYVTILSSYEAMWFSAFTGIYPVSKQPSLYFLLQQFFKLKIGFCRTASLVSTLQASTPRTTHNVVQFIRPGDYFPNYL